MKKLIFLLSIVLLISIVEGEVFETGGLTGSAPEIKRVEYQIYNIEDSEIYRLVVNINDAQSNVDFWYFDGLGSAIEFTNQSLVLDLGTPTFPILNNLTLNDTTNLKTVRNCSLDFSRSWAQNTSKTRNVSYQVVFLNLTFNALSTQLNISYNATAPQDSIANLTPTSGEMSNLLGVGNRYIEWYGDWITESQSSIVPYDSEVLVRTAYHTQNLTGYVDLTITNNNTNTSLQVYYEADIPSPWTNTSAKKILLTAPSQGSASGRVNLTLDAVYEDQYIETWETVVGNKVKHTYIAYIIVRENDTTKTLPIRYHIPKSRLTDWDSRVSSPAAYATVNGSSNDVSIEETITGYVDVVVGTSYSTSSLSQGTWEYQVVYYTPKPPGPGGPAGGIVPTPVLFEVRPEAYDIVGCPNVKIPIELKVLNEEKRPISIILELEGDTDIIDTDFTLTSLEALNNLTIPLTIRCPSLPADQKVIAKIKAKKGLITSIREVPIYLKMVNLRSQKIGERCWANECCESGYCSPEGVCAPVEEKVEKIPTYYYIIGIAAILLLILLVMRRRV